MSPAPDPELAKRKAERVLAQQRYDRAITDAGKATARLEEAESQLQRRKREWDAARAELLVATRALHVADHTRAEARVSGYHKPST